MCKVVDNLKRSRETLKHQFLEVKRLGVHTMEGRNRLMESKQTLMNHLKHGNLMLCPKIKKNAPADEQLLQLIEAFEDETRQLELMCGDFFNKYEQKGGGIEFFRDFHYLEDCLVQHRRKEGDILHAI